MKRNVSDISKIEHISHIEFVGWTNGSFRGAFGSIYFYVLARSHQVEREKGTPTDKNGRFAEIASEMQAAESPTKDSS